MKVTYDKQFYKELNSHKNFKYKYRLTYVGSCIYQLTQGKYKVLYKCYTFRTMYNFIKENKLNLNEIHMPYMTLHEFFRDWVSFDKDSRI